MGGFNTIFFDCPHCGTRIEDYTKTGTCRCLQYHIDDKKFEDINKRLDTLEERK